MSVKDRRLYWSQQADEDIRLAPPPVRVVQEPRAGSSQLMERAARLMNLARKFLEDDDVASAIATAGIAHQYILTAAAVAELEAEISAWG